MASNRQEKLIIIDGNALIHRSFHALPPTMATKSGEMVNAVYGFTNFLIKAIRELRPNYIALTLDRKGPTFRHEEYKEYKATRVKAPDELYSQIKRVKEVAQAFNIPIYEKDGLEADDLIGTIVKTINGNIEKIILTGDMDTLQLVDDYTKVYTMSRGITEAVLYDEKAVVSRYGLEPDQIVDYKALRGDPSDNIPGVKGIGEKTAVELLQRYKTLENLYEDLDALEIKDRIRGLLKEHKEEAFLSKRLATIKIDCEIEFDLQASRFGNINQNEIVRLFSELEFKSLLARVQDILGKAAGPQVVTSPSGKEFADKYERNKKLFKYQLIDNEKKFNSFLEKLKKQKHFVIDTETSSIDPITTKLLGISFSWKEGEAYYVSVKNQKSKIKNDNLFNYNTDTESVVIQNEWLQKLKPILEDEKIKKFGHNTKFDFEVLVNQGIDIKGFDFDTMIASYLLNPGTRQHNLDSITFTELGFEKISKNDLLGKGRERIAFDQVETEKMSLYSSEDADFTFRLVNKLGKQLKEQKLEELFEQIELPLSSVLAGMELNGINIDKNFLNNLSKKLHQKIEKLENKIYEQAGRKFNINSTQQLREVLFDELEISAVGIIKTKTGLSTAADELEKLKDQHEIIILLQEYRELNKLCNTYVDTLPELINEKTGRLHTCFNQTVTATGRLSSSDPNLQNIPVRGEWGKAVRRAFVADKGYKFVALDYSQIELRLAAHMSGDEKMIKAFNGNLDIHIATAAAINEVGIKEVTKNMRSEAKAVNFGILYGQGPHGLSQNANITYIRAKEFIDNYFKVYSGIKKFIDQTIEETRERGYIETLFGRRRYLPELNSSVMQVRRGAERMAINTPLQGTAADMIKMAMISVQKLLEKKYKDGEVKMLLQVHDELLFEVKEEHVEKSTKEIKQIMENVIKLKVPVIAEVKIGDNWGGME